jgi:hypothetical protein
MITIDWNALEVTGAMVESRALRFNDTPPENVGGFQFQHNSSSTFANELKFAAAKSVRTSIVTLASFNIMAAVLTLMGICWDSYKAAKKRDPNFNLRASFFRFIGSADAFPFILSFGVIYQGITFAYVQSRGFESLSILNCTGIAQAMLPATFITIFIQVVLGGEMAIRGLLRRPFPTRSRWVLPGCLALIFTMLVVTIVIAQVNLPPNFCFASLYWLVHRWKTGVLVTAAIMTFLLLVELLIVTIRLRSNADIAETERLAAFRMVFYLATAVISLACLLPFFIQSVVMDITTEAYELTKYGMVASVVGNLTGIITGGCYVFLRTKKVQRTNSSDWSNVGKLDLDQEKDPRVVSVESDDRWLSQIQQPVQPPRYSMSGAFPPMTGRQEVQRPASIVPRKPSLAMPFPQAPASTDQAPAIHIRQSSAGQVEPQLPATPGWLLPTTTYDPFSQSDNGLGSLLPPPKIRSPDGISHRRGDSLESTATVQIGLRLSNVNDMPAYPTARGQVDSVAYSTAQGSRDSQLVPPIAPTAHNKNSCVMSVIIASPQASQGEEIRLSPTVYNPNPTPTPKKPVARNSAVSDTSRYEDDAVPDPLFSRKDNAWI